MCEARFGCQADRVPLRCVIVDDNDSFLEAVRVLLERQGLAVAGVAGNVAEGVERVHELKPDLVLVDIDLAGESGFSVVRQLAAEPDDGCPVILISAHPGEDFADLVAESTAVGFIAKAELSAESVWELLDGPR